MRLQMVVMGDRKRFRIEISMDTRTKGFVCRAIKNFLTQHSEMNPTAIYIINSSNHASILSIRTTITSILPHSMTERITCTMALVRHSRTKILPEVLLRGKVPNSTWPLAIFYTTNHGRIPTTVKTNKRTLSNLKTTIGSFQRGLGGSPKTTPTKFPTTILILVTEMNMGELPLVLTISNRLIRRTIKIYHHKNTPTIGQRA